MKIKDFPAEERPREKLMNNDVENLSNSELLAVILRCGSKNENVLNLSHKIFKKNDLSCLATRNVNELVSYYGIGKAKACQIVAVFELARRLYSNPVIKKRYIKNYQDAYKLLKSKLSNKKKEHFIGIFLDSRGALIKTKTIFIGTLDASVIHPREIFREAILESARSIIIAHNHPSGDPTPSGEDILITKRLLKASKYLEIDLLDHIIIGNNCYFSMKSENII